MAMEPNYEEIMYSDVEEYIPIQRYADKWRDFHPNYQTKSAGIVTHNGLISLRLHDEIQIYITVDQAVRVVNKKNSTVLALSGSGSAGALIHPNGRVHQSGSRVEIAANDLHEGNHKYAKMCYKGVSFTSEECTMNFLVDTEGTKTISDTFPDMYFDFSLNVFLGSSRVGSHCVAEAIKILENSKYWISDDGADHWIINNLRITQAADGLLRIAKSSNKYLLRTSPLNGTASLSTPFIHTTASLGSTSHLFVRRGDRRMHFDGSNFIVRNAGQSAGFNDKSQLKVY